MKNITGARAMVEFVGLPMDRKSHYVTKKSILFVGVTCKSSFLYRNLTESLNAKIGFVSSFLFDSIHRRITLEHTSILHILF